MHKLKLYICGNPQQQQVNKFSKKYFLTPFNFKNMWFNLMYTFHQFHFI